MIFKKIGIFDSGIGGLSLVKKLLTIPGLELVYYADTAHVPYGNRSKEEIQQLSYSAIQFLVEQQVDAVIIACHTASTNALDYLKERFPTIYFIDVVELIINQTRLYSPKKIGILGTHATIASGIHKNLLLRTLPECEIITQECPQLASAIETDYANQTYLPELVKNYCKPLIDGSVDAVLLACTHYSLIQPVIMQAFNYPIQLISAEHGLQKKLKPFTDFSLTNVSTLKMHSTAHHDDFITKTQMIICPLSLNIIQAQIL